MWRSASLPAQQRQHANMQEKRVAACSGHCLMEGTMTVPMVPVVYITDSICSTHEQRSLRLRGWGGWGGGLLPAIGMYISGHKTAACAHSLHEIP